MRNKILIVDSASPQMDSVQEILNEAGFESSLVDKSTAILGKIRNFQPDLILLAAKLSDADSFEVCRSLRETASTRALPILMLTESTKIADRLKAFEAGAADYILKPIKTPELLARVNTQIELKKCQEELLQKRLQAEQLEARIERLTSIDGLTAIPNRRSFSAFFDKEWKRAVRNSEPLALILLDIDYFEPLNKKHGHQYGDECLRKIAETVEDVSLRPGDFPARYENDTFVILLANTDLLGAVTVADNTHTRIEELRLRHLSSPISPYVTVSVGVAAVMPSLKHSPEELFQATQKALISAQEKGRNRVDASPVWWT